MTAATHFRLAERWRRWQERSVNRRIFGAALVVGGFTLAGRAAGFVKELLVARQFGTSDELDAFLIALLLPSFCANVVAGAVAPALLPALMRARRPGPGQPQEDAAAVQAFVSEVSLILVVALSGVTLLLAAAGRPLLEILGSGFGAQKAGLAHVLYLLLLPSVLLSALAGLWAGLLNARHQFALAAASPMLVPLAIAALLVTAGGALGARALVFGTLAGLLGQAVLLGGSVARQGYRLTPRWHGATPALRQFLGQCPPMAAGLVFMSGTDLVDQAMAAMLGPGSVSALAYGNRVVSGVLGLTSAALGTALLPSFADMAARADWAGLRHTVRTYARPALLLTACAALALFFLSTPLVRLLFERGAFGSDDTLVVSRVQACYALQIPFYTLSLFGVRLLSALSRNQTLMWICLVNLVVNAAGNYLLMQWLGVAGIALSTSVVYLVSLGLIALALRAELRRRRAAAGAWTPPPGGSNA